MGVLNRSKADLASAWIGGHCGDQTKLAVFDHKVAQEIWSIAGDKLSDVDLVCNGTIAEKFISSQEGRCSLKTCRVNQIRTVWSHVQGRSSTCRWIGQQVKDQISKQIAWSLIGGVVAVFVRRKRRMQPADGDALAKPNPQLIKSSECTTRAQNQPTSREIVVLRDDWICRNFIYIDDLMLRVCIRRLIYKAAIEAQLCVLSLKLKASSKRFPCSYNNIFVDRGNSITNSNFIARPAVVVKRICAANCHQIIKYFILLPPAACSIFLHNLDCWSCPKLAPTCPMI